MYMMNDREFSNRKETLHGEFYENALKYPERIALIYENEKVSYKMLRLYALRAANYMWQLFYCKFAQYIREIGTPSFCNTRLKNQSLRIRKI